MSKLFVRAAVIIVVLWLEPVGSSVVDAKVLKDPTEPQVDFNPAKPSLNPAKDIHLSAIFISGSERYAVINDKVVKKGDSIGNKVIQAIDPYTVTLMDNGKENILYLLGSELSIKGQPK